MFVKYVEYQYLNKSNILPFNFSVKGFFCFLEDNGFRGETGLFHPIATPILWAVISAPHRAAALFFVLEALKRKL